MDSKKYLRHLTPLCIEGWERHIASDLVSVCKDEELPEDFRNEIKAELLEINEEAKRAIIENEMEEI